MSCKCTDGHCSERLDAFKKHPCTAVVKKSTLPNSGNGLFAEKEYKRGEFVTYYSGTVTNIPIEGDRVLQINKKTWINGEGPCTRPTAVGDFLNHALPANTRFCISSHPISLVCIKTTKKVKAGEEFFINYGREYWESLPVPKVRKQKIN